MDNSNANMSIGQLRFNVTSTVGQGPIKGAEIEISFTSDPESIQERLTTNESGQSGEVNLATPPFSFSQQPDEPIPFAQYSATIRAEGYAPVNVTGMEIFARRQAIQNIRMRPLEVTNQENDINIPLHTLVGDYPPKIPEDEIKPTNESGEIVLSRVVVPEYVVVHDGPPSDSGAMDYYVTYKDYIKNVASCEIYSTWPEEAIKANILAIMSFTLNRVYTEWYRNKGYDFTITSSTAYDQKWSYGRNIFQNISEIVDELFNSYISRPNVRQPILTQYCDGKRVTCSDWLSQWGSKYLGDQDYSAIQILRYYYGSDIYINQAEEIAGIPASWPGQDLEPGSTGEKVRQMQEQLARISQSYPAITRVSADGVYGPATQQAVEQFQRIFGLPVTGVVDYPTWYKISEIYVGVTRIAELR